MTRKALSVCVISAVLGATLSQYFLTGERTPTAAAQSPSTRVRPSEKAEATATDDRVPLDDLSPEERINVAVYENANRSVVNISTVATRPSAFMLLEYESEGAGSGSVLD